MKLINSTAFLLLALSCFAREIKPDSNDLELVGAPLVEPGVNALSMVLDSQRGVGERLKAVHKLGGDLSAEEVAAIYKFLKSRWDDRVTQEASRAIKNDLMNVLRHQSVLPSELSNVLIGLYNDSSQDPVIRDYAIQHLGYWYSRLDGDVAREQIKEVLINALGENSSIAGTALLAVHRLSRDRNEFDSKKIEERALALVTSPQTDKATRVTALQICAERNLAGALPVIQELAQSSSEVGVRISAISALGQLGGAEQVNFVKELQSKEKSKVLQPSMEAAASSLRRKLQLF